VDQEKRDDVEWLFQCMLTTLKDAMQNAGPLFAFVPEFYVEACISAYSALKSYFTPSLLSLHSPGTWFIFLISARGMICFRLFQSAVAAMLRLCDCDYQHGQLDCYARNEFQIYIGSSSNNNSRLI